MMSALLTEDSGYLSYLGLSHNPFPVVPDEACIFLSSRIEQIVAEIVHGVIARKGFMVLTGDIGLGKTTISRRIISILEEKDVKTSLVLHTSLQDAELLREINRDFGIEVSTDLAAPNSLGEQLRQLNQFLVDQNRQNKNCAIIIDDAQNLNRQSLELVRMISNLEGDRHKLVQILLIGQPELAELLNTHDLRQLRSRVVITAKAEPMRRRELNEYIQFKLNLAGNHGQTSVTNWAVHQVYQYTRGNFRKVNLLMDRCLYVACLFNSHKITLGTVRTAYKDLYPRQKRRMIRWATVGALPLFFWGVVGLGQGGNRFFSERIRSPLKLVVSASSDPDQTDTKQDPSNNGSSASKSDAGGVAYQSASVADPYSAFFHSVGLAAYTEKFRQALSRSSIIQFNDDLFQNTGFELIGLNRLNPEIRQNFGVLSLAKEGQRGQRHYILWRPPFLIKKFYYYYQGEEIHQLQLLLAKANLYHDKMDHIVGPRLMQAVVEFQKLNDLPVTGFPDSLTIFRLCQI